MVGGVLKREAFILVTYFNVFFYFATGPVTFMVFTI